MSAPAWLMDAIKAAANPEKADLPVAVTACNRNQNGLRLHSAKPGNPVNKGFHEFVTAVTAVTAEKEAPREFSEVAPEFDEEALHTNWVFHFIDCEPETAVFLAPVNYRKALKLNPGAIAVVPVTVTVTVECKNCKHFARPGHSAEYCGGRTDLPPAYGDNHPLRMLPEDGGKSCKVFRHHQTKGKL